MRRIALICGKEIVTYLSSPMAYIVSAIFIALSGASFTTYLAQTSYSDTSIRGFLETGQLLILLFSALLTMRLISEERKLGTWELLLTAPVREYEIVLGKFFSCLLVLAGMLILTLYFPLLLMIFGDPDTGPILTSYLGLFLLGSASVAIGIFASSLTPNQIVSAVVAGGILFGLWFLGMVGSLIPEPLGEILSYFSLSEHFPGFVRGVVDTRDLVYYLSVTAVFLFLSVRSIETERWR
ncbi:MAG: ABC transporter permease [SAR324 cluster bacterium]|nr:ABC transporter permease [SAR324 cluster bacterium]